MVQARITKFLLWDATRTVVFSDEISCPWLMWFPSNESTKEGYPLYEDVILMLLARIV